MKRLALLAFLLPFFFISSANAAAPLPLHVVASFSILADMVKNVGGEDVVVTSLVGPDSDTHTYQPTPSDVKSLAHADLVFVNGLGFEGWMQRLIEASGFKGTVAVASQGITPRQMTDDGKQVTDPHAWQDLSNGHIYVQNIAAALALAAPTHTAEFRKRAMIYDAELLKEEKVVRTAFAGIPPAQRKIITSHDAFGYFGAAYGVTFLAPEGVSTESEASASGIAALIRQIKAEGIKEVFIENMTNPKLIRQIGKDAGAKMGGTLYSDALSSDKGPAPTYLAMFENNVPKLKASMLEIGTK
jgi:zinc/manganese transport system substrate-binding protein